MKKIFFSLLLALYVTFSLTGCKSFVTSAPEQWVAKIGDAMVLIEDTKGLIELAKELGMEWVTLVKQKNGTYTIKDHTQKESKATTSLSLTPNARVLPDADTSLAPATASDPNEIKVPISDIIRRTRVVH
jgi:hypothetical protein